MNSYLSLCLIVLTVFGVGDKYLRAADCNLECISSLELPRATNGISGAWLPDGEDGVVRISLQVTGSGGIKNLSIQGATASLRSFSERWIRESHFEPACQGRTVTLIYVYRVYKAPASLHLPSVTVKPDNTFILSFEEARPPGPLRQRIIPREELKSGR